MGVETYLFKISRISEEQIPTQKRVRVEDLKCDYFYDNRPKLLELMLPCHMTESSDPATWSIRKIDWELKIQPWLTKVPASYPVWDIRKIKKENGIPREARLYSVFPSEEFVEFCFDKRGKIVKLERSDISKYIKRKWGDVFLCNQEVVGRWENDYNLYHDIEDALFAAELERVKLPGGVRTDDYPLLTDNVRKIIESSAEKKDTSFKEAPYQTGYTELETDDPDSVICYHSFRTKY